MCLQNIEFLLPETEREPRSSCHLEVCIVAGHSQVANELLKAPESTLASSQSLLDRVEEVICVQVLDVILFQRRPDGFKDLEVSLT